MATVDAVGAAAGAAAAAVAVMAVGAAADIATHDAVTFCVSAMAGDTGLG
jgi:hypothetical protein